MFWVSPNISFTPGGPATLHILKQVSFLFFVVVVVVFVFLSLILSLAALLPLLAPFARFPFHFFFTHGKRYVSKFFDISPLPLFLKRQY